MGAAFFAESMFSAEDNGSKVAMVALMGRLLYGNFSLLDVQFISDHLSRMGAEEISRNKYEVFLNSAIKKKRNFYKLPTHSSLVYMMQLNNQKL